MTRAEETEKDVVVVQDKMGRVSGKAVRSDRLMKPIAVLVRDQMYHHILVKMAEKRYMNG